MRFTVCVALAAAFVMTGCSSKTTSPPDAPSATEPTSSVAFESPEATFQTLKTAMLEKDYATFCDCWAPDGLALLAGGSTMGISMFAGVLAKDAEGDTPEAKLVRDRIDRMKQLLIKNGFEDAKLPDVTFIAGDNAPKPMQEQVNDHMLSLAEKIKDKRTFVAEFIAIVHETDEGQNYMMLSDDATLSNVLIDGDQATGTIKKTTSENVRDIHAVFVNIDGQWKLLEAKGLEM